MPRNNSTVLATKKNPPLFYGSHALHTRVSHQVMYPFDDSITCFRVSDAMTAALDSYQRIAK